MLQNDNDEHGIHYRMKGVSLNTVAKVAKDTYGGYGIDSYENNLFELYHELYDGKKINFNLLSTAPRFKNTKARTVTNCDKFARGVSFDKSIKRNEVN